MTSKNNFNRNHGKPGWLYVARNDLMREDLYKVGCTSQRYPETRTAQLNSEQRGGTSRIGFFNLIFAVAVLDAQGSEAALLRRLEVLKESKGKEFVNAPLELIVGEALYIQKRDLEAVTAIAPCPACHSNNRFPAHPFVRFECGHCRSPFIFVEPGITRHATDQDKHGYVYSVIKQMAPVEHSPLAKAFLQMRNAVREYAIKAYKNGQLNKGDFQECIKHWITYEPPLDRSPLLYQKPPTSRKPRSRPTKLKTRSGWVECPECVSSIEPNMDGLAICLECGWSNDRED